MGRPVLAAVSSPTSSPSRHQHHLLWVVDCTTHARYLVDSGAAVSVLPPSGDHKRPPELVAYDLIAANGSPIPTYGAKDVSITLSPARRFHWKFIVAEVRHPILGADFLVAHNLTIDLRQRQIVH